MDSTKDVEYMKVQIRVRVQVQHFLNHWHQIDQGSQLEEGGGVSIRCARSAKIA